MENSIAVSNVRELTSRESALLGQIISQVAPDRLNEIQCLKVIGRCGCGKCPTVIFGINREQKLSTQPPVAIANFTGVNDEGTEVGLSLLVRDGAISEMEVWALDCEPVRSLPLWESMTCT